MRSWSLDDVKPEDRKNFIIECLQEYIDEANEFFDFERITNAQEIEAYNVSKLYEAIIEELKNKK